MLKNLVKRIIREMVWSAKKKNYHTSIDTAMKTGWQSRIRSLHFQRYRKIIELRKLRKMNFGKRFMRLLPISPSF